MSVPSVESALEQLQTFMPLAIGSTDLRHGKLGVVIIDPVVGFTRSGPLSDQVSMAPMVDAIDHLCRELGAAIPDRVRFFVFRDHHRPGQIEPPYPPHCQEGTGEELLDPVLRWLETEPLATLMAKDCINGMIGALVPAGQVETPTGSVQTYRNLFVEWAVEHGIEQLLVVGDCTDICVLDFVVAVLSARNHKLFGEAAGTMPVEVFTPACATYHLPEPEALGLPETARHDGGLTAHAALYFMQSRGARLVERYTLDEPA